MAPIKTSSHSPLWYQCLEVTHRDTPWIEEDSAMAVSISFADGSVDTVMVSKTLKEKDGDILHLLTKNNKN